MFEKDVGDLLGIAIYCNSFLYIAFVHTGKVAKGNVVNAYSAMKDDELDLVVGETIDIFQMVYIFLNLYLNILINHTEIVSLKLSVLSLCHFDISSACIIFISSFLFLRMMDGVLENTRTKWDFFHWTASKKFLLSKVR